MIAKIIRDQENKVIHNTDGSNLPRGLASIFIQKSTIFGTIKADYGVFEVDEAALPFVLQQLRPNVVVLTNLFRDQLDRYGEIDTLAEKWITALKDFDKQTKIILNADDPVIATLGQKVELPTSYYGVGSSTFCPRVAITGSSAFRII